MNRKRAGLLIGAAGAILVVTAFLAAIPANCPGSIEIGAGPPSCGATLSWTALPLSLLIVGLILGPIGGVVMRSHRA